MKRFIRDLVGHSLQHTSILLYRPVYIGFTVLDVSKAIMYDFNYRYEVRKYDPEVNC